MPSDLWTRPAVLCLVLEETCWSTLGCVLQLWACLCLWLLQQNVNPAVTLYRFFFCFVLLFEVLVLINGRVVQMRGGRNDAHSSIRNRNRLCLLHSNRQKEEVVRCVTASTPRACVHQRRGCVCSFENLRAGYVICAMPPQRLCIAFLFLQVCLRLRRAAAALRREVMLLRFSEASVLTRYLLGGGSGGESVAEEGDIPDIPGLHTSGSNTSG